MRSISFLICIAPFFLMSYTGKRMQPNLLVNVKSFGAKGDGVTDDYKSLQSVANYITSKGGGEVYFPNGTYYIAAYHTNTNTVKNIEFKNCNNLKITGSNAVISVNGNFKRPGDIKRKYLYSSTAAITPIVVTNCRNLSISNLEINGNVNRTTRDKGVVEPSSYLLMINQCTNVELRDLNLHHGSSDGLYITGDNNPTDNLKAMNVVLANNARQGMSIIKLQNAVFTNCKFINTGFSEGRYGHHAPSAGVDIEPHGGADIVVEHIKFDNCEFRNNLGGQVLISNPTNTNDIVLQNSTIDAGNSKSAYTAILSAQNVKVLNCRINCQNGNIYPVWQNAHNSSVIIDNCVIESAMQGIMAASKDPTDDVIIRNNTLNFTGAVLKSYFPYLQSPNVSLTNNKIFIPVRTLTTKAAHSLVQNARSSEKNVFYTDDKKVRPKVSYLGTKIVNDN